MNVQQYLKDKFKDVTIEPEQMHAYQRMAFEFVRDNPFSALFMDMGLGKTVISGTLIAHLLSEFAPGKTLVIGPLRVMTDTWPTDFRRWRHLAPWNYTLIREDDDNPRIKAAAKLDRDPATRERRADLRKKAVQVRDQRLADLDDRGVVGGKRKTLMKAIGREFDEATERSNETLARQTIRAELSNSTADIHFINREMLEWLVNLHGPKWPYRTVIIDESDSFKDHDSERFKALAKVRRTPGLITRMHLLSATPDSEGCGEYFSQIYLLDLGERLGKNVTRFREEYMTHNQWTRKWTPRPDAEERILDGIKDICLVMKARDYLDTEEPSIIAKPIKLPRAAMQVYEAMAQECVVAIDGRQVEAETAAALTGKLQQISSGVLYETYFQGDWETEDLTKVKKVHNIHDAKIETLREIHEGLRNKPLLVVYHFKATLDKLKKAFPTAVDIGDKGYTQSKWDAGKIPMLLVHPASAGHGLNLQYGGSNMVMFDIPWALRQYLQVIGRLARQGQKNPVLVQILVASGTVDEEVWESLKNKEDAQDRRHAILKSLISRYRSRNLPDSI